MRKSIFFGIAFFLLSFFTIHQMSYAFSECETGNYTACNTNGSKTGHVMDVTNNNGQWSCVDTGSPPACVQQICGQSIQSYNECGDTTGGPCNNNGGQQLITVSYCPSNGQYYCYNQGPQPGCGLPNNPPPPTNTPIPTNTPVPVVNGPTPTPTAAPSTNLTVVLGLPGIGYDGNVPQHASRNITIELYAPAVQNPGGPGTTPVKTATGIVQYDSGSDNNAGYFVSNIPITFNNLVSGNYQILVKLPQYLYKLAKNPQNTDNPTVFTLNTNTTTVLSPLILSSGDVAVTGGQVNHMNINDYNILLSCYGDKATSSCPVKTAGAGGTNLADLNDDGNVDIVDLNIWLRSLHLLQKANTLGCDVGDCQGD